MNSQPLRVALIGNPNTGKSTLFGALVGIHQHVGNYPGCTVEKKTGSMDLGERQVELIDLPGLYSLAPRSRDEMIAADLLLGRRENEPPPDAVLCIVDASNLCRNLYLVSQVLDLGKPTVVAVNMIDVAERRGTKLDLARLERQLGVPVVAVQANRGIGIDLLKRALAESVARGPRRAETPFPPAFEHEVRSIEELMQPCCLPRCCCREMPRAAARRLLLDVGGHMQRALPPAGHDEVTSAVDSARQRLGAQGLTVPGIEPESRYAWVRQVLDGVVALPAEQMPTATDRIDRWLTHRFWGTLVFMVVMGIMFQAVFRWAEPAMDLFGGVAAAVGEFVAARMAQGALRSLLTDGVIGGVGSVLKFLPQIAILFLFIAVLEDCGYMARAAYLMDRLMVRVGLSGKSFIPMLSSFACSVPGIMAARVVEDERDHITTILVAPLLTCSARLPVYTLLIAALIPNRSWCFGLIGLQGLTLASLYVLGVVAAVLVALALKRTILRGKPTPLLLELPSYKWPSPRTVLMRVCQRTWAFLYAAGTLILAISILTWAALYYPHNAPTARSLEAEAEQVEAELSAMPDGASPQLEKRLAQLQHQASAEYQKHSFLGRLGHWIEPAVRPLGWDWRIGCAVLASFPAREVVVATMGVMFHLSDADTPVDDESQRGADQLRHVTWEGTDTPVFNVPVALSIMVFFALCAQCAATLAVMARETNSWRWPAFAFVYMTTLAYLGALVTYQTGMCFGG